MATATLTYTLSGSTTLSPTSTATCTATYVVANQAGTAFTADIDSVPGTSSWSISTTSKSGTASGTASKTLPKFGSISSITYAVSGSTLSALSFYNASGSAVSLTVGGGTMSSTQLGYVTAIGASGTLKVYGKASVSASGTGRGFSTSKSAFSPQSFTTNNGPVGRQVTHSATQTVTNSVSASFSTTVTFTITYTAPEGIDVVTDQTAISYGDTITATVTPTSIAKYSIVWLLNGTVIDGSASSYYTYTSAHTFSTTAYNSSNVTEETNTGKVLVRAYNSDNELVDTAYVTFTVYGPQPPAKLLNIEAGGVAIGQLCTSTSSSPQFQVHMDSEFNQKVTARNGFTISEGWKSLTLSSGVTASTIAWAPAGPGIKYRVEGTNHVYISVNVAYTASDEDEALVLATGLPEAYRPPRNCWYFGMISPDTSWNLNKIQLAAFGINTAGSVYSYYCCKEGWVADRYTSTVKGCCVLMDYYI